MRGDHKSQKGASWDKFCWKLTKFLSCQSVVIHKWTLHREGFIICWQYNTRLATKNIYHKETYIYMVNYIFCLWLINKNCISCLWLGFPATVQWTSTPLEQMNQALDIRCFDWQIWQVNDNTPALWLLFKYISKAEITARISFLMAFTLTVGTEWIPLVGWRLKDTSMHQRCNFLPFLIPSHLCMAQFKLSGRSSKFRIQSLSHFSEISLISVVLFGRS